MRTYFRLLSFAKPLGKYAIPYIIFIVFSVIFGTLNLALVAPLLNVLFSGKTTVLPPAPEHALDIFAAFNYYSSLWAMKFGAYKTLEIVCLIIITSVLLSNLFKYFAERTIENLRIQTLLNLRQAVFNNVMRLDIAYFNSQRKGDIISKISSDVQTVQFSVTGTLQVIFKEPLTLLAYLVMLFVLSYKLTLFAILIIPVSAFVISKIVKKLKEHATASHESYGTMISYLDEALNGMRIIKAFNAVPFITKRFNDENKHYSGIVRSMSKRQQLASPVSEFLGVMMVAGILLYGGSLVLSDQSALNGANFIAYIALFSQIMRPAKAISTSFSNIHSGISAGERVLALIDEKPSIKDEPDAIVLKDFEHNLRFENVSFSYGDHEVLHHINLTLTKGKSVALVGPSGGGKSTLMDMIPRFIQPKSGKILIDGQDIQHVKTDSLRSLMGIVNQESILFNDTIFNNIAFGKPGTTKEEVEAAAKIANAHEFICNTKNGYDTNIGDKGVRLSGGQKQRICIARAVLNNPPIMLLDEATSALDTESEKMVQAALNNLMKHRTSLIIAHRLSTIQNADKIIVLEKGSIVEEGTHQQLIAQNGLYKKLIDMQTFISFESEDISA